MLSIVSRMGVKAAGAAVAGDGDCNSPLICLKGVEGSNLRIDAVSAKRTVGVVGAVEVELNPVVLLVVDGELPMVAGAVTSEPYTGTVPS